MVMAMAMAAPALAGDYGGTTVPGGSDGPSCFLSITAGAVGASVTATVTGVPTGETVRIIFDSEEVGRATAGGDVTANATAGAVVFGGPQQAVGTATVEVTFRVPARGPGTYLVSAVADSFSRPCGSGDGSDFQVLAAGAVADRGGSGPLPKTGIYVGALVLTAAALVIAGRGVLGESKRRRRSHAGA